MKSITEDTQESQGSEVTESSAVGGLRARLERYERSAAGGIQLPVDDPAPETPSDTVPRSAEDPVSPELVLVDPELAGRARALLPEPRPFAPPPRVDAVPEPVVAEQVAPQVEPAPEPEPPGVARPRRKRRVAAYALALVLLAAAAAAVVVYAVLLGGSSSGHDNAAPSAVNTPRANPPPSEPQPSAKPPAPAAASRAFVWAPVRGARWYLVQFYRGSTEVFRARPTEARIVVPAHWSYNGHRLSLQPGRYRWSVRPRLGGAAGQHYGKPIVLSQLVVQRSSSGGGQSTRSP